MTKEQLLICETLLALSREHGFHYFSIELLAEKTGIPALEIYDANRDTGHLWPLDARASGPLAGMLFFNKGAVALSEDHEFIHAFGSMG
jgi:hypothetical protein